VAGLDVRLLNDPFLLIQVGKFRCDALRSGQDLCALRLEIVHIDCLGQVGFLPSGKVFVALRKLPLVAASLSHQRVLLGTRTRLPACDLCGNKRGIT
jgi:hypothetical protein